MTFGVALEVLRKQSNCWDKITECPVNCEKCECYVDASDLVEAVRAVLDNFPTQMSGTSNSSTKFKPGSKFLLEIGEKRIGLDEYSIVGTDLYVWGSLLEKLTSYEPDGDTISRQDAIKALCAGCVENSDEECKFRKYVGGCPNYDFMTSLPSVQAKQKWTPCSERLPDKPSTYMVTDGKGDVVRFVFYDSKCNREYWKRCAKAWMPLPEPYRGDTDE